MEAKAVITTHYSILKHLQVEETKHQEQTGETAEKDMERVEALPVTLPMLRVPMEQTVS